MGAWSRKIAHPRIIITLRMECAAISWISMGAKCEFCISNGTDLTLFITSADRS